MKWLYTDVIFANKVVIRVNIGIAGQNGTRIQLHTYDEFKVCVYLFYARISIYILVVKLYSPYINLLVEYEK